MVQAKVLDRQRYNPSLKTGFRGLNSFKRFFVFTASLFFAAAFAGFLGCGSSSGSSSGGGDSGSGSGTGFVKVELKGKTFKMGNPDASSGDEQPSHDVTFTRNLLVCDHEVTQGEWCAVFNGADENPSNFSSDPVDGETQDNRPVENVNWYMAIAYCNKLSFKEGLDPCYSVKVSGSEVDWKNLAFSGIPKNFDNDWNAVTCDWDKTGYRLPTEAEWEIAARGGVEGDVWAGTATNASNELKDYAWYSVNSVNKTHEVKQKQANGYGLYDMSGNVWEWCWDWYENNQYETDKDGVTDPKGPSSGSDCVERGGAWNEGASECRVAYRTANSPQDRGDGIGFRLVRSAE